MLIPSHRHTAADLDVWKEYEAADYAHGETLNRRIETAMDHIYQFSRTRCCCAVSWGKDSLVLADLVMYSAPRVPIYWVRWPRYDNPDSDLVMVEFARRWPEARLEQVIAPSDDNDDGSKGFELLARKAGDRRITGIRREESSTRRISAAVHGVATSKSCRPLLNWSLSDVFGYAGRYSLALHPVYGMSGGGRWPRESLRVDSLGGRRGDGLGRQQWEREYYGDVLRRLEV